MPDEPKPTAPRQAHKRTAFQREQDCAEIARLYLARKPQYEIAEILSAKRNYTLSRQQIGYDLKHIQDRWRKESYRALDELKSQELARLDEVERQAWTAWDASKLDSRVRRETRNGVTIDVEGPGRPKSIDQVQQLTNRDGDPRFLSIIMTVIEKRCDLLGINAPRRMELQATTNLVPVDKPAEVVILLPSNGRETAKLPELPAIGGNGNGHTDPAG